MADWSIIILAWLSSSYIAHRELQIRSWNISLRGSPLPKQWAFRALYLCRQYHTVDNILCACISQLILFLTSRQKVQTEGVWPRCTWTQRTAMGRCRCVHGMVGGERGGAKRGDRKTKKITRKIVHFVIWVVKMNCSIFFVSSQPQRWCLHSGTGIVWTCPIHFVMFLSCYYNLPQPLSHHTHCVCYRWMRHWWTGLTQWLALRPFSQHTSLRWVHTNTHMHIYASICKGAYIAQHAWANCQ